MFADDTCTSVHGKDVKTVCDKLQQEAENYLISILGVGEKQNDN